MSEIEVTRNIGISAHIDSGKTTLTERILYYAGRIHKIEEVRGGGSGATMDHMELEKERGITITSAATTVHWHDKKINIIDTPGHVDFTVEVERSLRVLDGAILVLCSVAGVQSQSITVDRQMKRYRVPRLVFINKMDRTGADPFKGVKELKEKLGLHPVLMQLPIGAEDQFDGVADLVTMKAYYFDGDQGETVREEEIPADMLAKAEEQREIMLEELTHFNDDLMELVLEGEDIPEDMIHATIKKGVQSLGMVPVYMGSAFKNKGVQRLLDAVERYLPSPLEAEPQSATDLDNPEGEQVPLEPDASKPLVCMAFKITEEQFGQVTYTRIYQGTLRKGETIYNTRTGKKLRVGRLVRMHADDKENIDEASAGDIIAMVGVDCASGDTFCQDPLNYACESIFVPEPVISLAIKPVDNAAATKMGKALNRFMKEDPTFRVRVDEESAETVIAGMGELHLEVYIERIKREYKAEVEVGAPQVNYRETIRREAEYDYTHKKQTGGSGQYGCVVGKIYPLDAEHEENFEFVNNIKGGNIPTEYIPACEKGFKDVMDEGPLAGFPMVRVGVHLNDGKYHDVDSSETAFRTASRQAMKQAIAKAKAVLLEPIMKVEVESPQEFQGNVVGSLSSRRGIIAGIDTQADGTCILNSSVPLSEMFGYSTELRSLTQGKASFSMEFEKYEAAPDSVAAKVMEERAERKNK
ncbi:elongation factor G [Acanthopleuribacter pedis]|uniref:Elongation factor G n=1 Tax=Acanthopleuribacter pedis TaxID=442870 RepID=A0A8J7Q3S9_9BACT|nr:elongation factor G [Acanthopleuribacter pedis]MBO1317814.1 elongation factor G [Acanthopleuribacter pedis]